MVCYELQVLVPYKWMDRNMQIISDHCHDYRRFRVIRVLALQKKKRRFTAEMTKAGGRVTTCDEAMVNIEANSDLESDLTNVLHVRARRRATLAGRNLEVVSCHRQAFHRLYPETMYVSLLI